MTLFQAIILGIIQGLTEFLPVSSSGHLLLAQEIMGIEGDHLFFFLMLHLGTLAAVIGVWHKEIFGLIKKPKETGLLILATLPVVILVLFAGDAVDGLFANGKSLCFFFLFTAILLFVTETVIKKHGERQKEVGLKGALIMGGMQALAVIPGISRSGATIAGGLLYGAEKERVTRFSFFMSAIAIVGGAVKEFYDLFKGGSLAGISAVNTIFGMLAAALTGFLAVKLMIKIIGSHSFKWFSLYLAILSVITFINYFVSPIW